MGASKDTIYFDFVSQPSRAVVLFIRSILLLWVPTSIATHPGFLSNCMVYLKLIYYLCNALGVHPFL